MITEILNYTIIKKLGEGAMGQVFLAKNKSIHQFVAIKMLHPQYASNPTLRDTFRQEAIMLSSLNHPNIVKFLNYVENENGVFLIMEYVDGMTLEDYINKKTGLIVEQKAIPMMKQILDAFSYAHKRDVIHRDIKPGNILVTKEGNIKILDFGIAQIISESDNKSKDYGGTIEYMSPEQVQGHKLDTRSDIYSLGVLFWQMLTGKAPYDVNHLSPLDIKKNIVNRSLGRMREIYPYISDGMQKLVDRATAKSSGNRYASCDEMKSDLRVVEQSSGAENASKSRKNKLSGITITVGTAIAVIIVGLLCFFLFVGNSDKEYQDFVYVKGGTKGIGKKIDKGADATFYRISYSKGKPARITFVDRHHQHSSVSDSILMLYKPDDMELVYAENGVLDYKNIYDRHGSLLYKLDYDDDLCEVTLYRFSGDSLVDSAMAGEPNRFNLKYNEQGILSEINYLDSVGNKMPYRGVYGQSFKHDKAGRLIQVNYLDENYEPTEDETGIGIIHFDYKGALNNATSKLFDKEGHPAVPHPVKPVANKKANKTQQQDRSKLHKTFGQTDRLN